MIAPLNTYKAASKCGFERFWVAFVSVLLMGQSSAQVFVIVSQLDPFRVSPSSMIEATVNVVSAGTFRVEATLIRAGSSGETVLQVRTASFPFQVGTYPIAPNAFSFDLVTYGQGDAGRSLMSTGLLPVGDYEHCITIVPVSGVEQGDQYCSPLNAEAMGFMDLMLPMDGDSIEETRPALAWSAIGMPGPSTARYQLTLVPVHSDQDARSAVTAEQAVVLLPDVADQLVGYPMDAPELERGKDYAWQVMAFDRSTGRMIGSTDAWRFHVIKPKKPQSLKYATLGSSVRGERCLVVDQRVFFRYDEPYGTERLICEIYDEEGKKVELLDVVRRGEASGAENVRKVGVNEYEFDLQGYGLKKGFFTLKVISERKDARYLRIEVEP